MDDALPLSLIGLQWLAWVAYWVVSARGAKASVRREPVASRLAHVLPLLLAAWLLSPRRRHGAAWLDAPWPLHGPALAWLGAVLCAAGLAFTVWARVHLGRNWSGTVTVKQGHELIRSGPYARVRHPIYTGLLLALAGTALARGNLAGVLAWVIAYAALWRKLRLEERWMAETFGAAYERYRREVPALWPRVS